MDGSSFQHPQPNPNLSPRRQKAEHIRKKAAERSRPHVTTTANGECIDFAGTWPTNFTKGLPHDANGIVEPQAMGLFVAAINNPDQAFKVPVGPRNATKRHRPDPSIYPATADDNTVKDFFHPANPGDRPGVRAWESPVSGHVYDLEGPDAGSVGMAPAPKLGSDELAAEMAEVYAMAILRDTPFTAMSAGDATTDMVISALAALPWFDPAATPTDAGGNPLSPFAQKRRAAQFLNGTALSRQTLFRGSTPGAKAGPYISQFMLQGNRDLRGATGPENGTIVYGPQRVDQRVEAQKQGVDYMTEWTRWLDVQNGANLKGTDQFEAETRFVTTPRDLASYVHFDALYQAYLNACLILLGHKAKHDRGLPEPNKTDDGAVSRDAFATFGGPHVLTLVTETATRALKAVRRQKYNFHLRARPEAMGGVACLSKNGLGAALGTAQTAASAHVQKLEAAAANGFSIMEAIAAANGPGGVPVEPAGGTPVNYLLPMAFPEGSPMHPAYGAGHATVAGSCTTMLKAFFEMYDEDGNELTLADIGMGVLVPTPDGQSLVPAAGINGNGLTIQGELDKVAANVSIGRNMAGVHYYSDYYDSLRMGERIAVGMLLEQAITYGEKMCMSFTSFDGDRITISHDGDPHDPATLTVTDTNGDPVSEDAWFLRHVDLAFATV
jgi:hypothetical protein